MSLHWLFFITMFLGAVMEMAMLCGGGGEDDEAREASAGYPLVRLYKKVVI